MMVGFAGWWWGKFAAGSHGALGEIIFPNRRNHATPLTPHQNPGALPVIKLRKELTEHQRKKLIKLENVSGLDAFFGRMGLHKLAARVFFSFFCTPTEGCREERHVERENFIALQSMRFFTN